MKKWIALLLAATMCLGFAACAKEPEFDAKKEFEFKVNAAVAVKCTLSYADVKTATTNLTDINVSGNTYTGKGKVTIRDNYGDTYVAKVTAVYTFDEEAKNFSKVSLDIETPRKQ